MTNTGEKLKKYASTFINEDAYMLYLKEWTRKQDEQFPSPFIGDDATAQHENEQEFKDKVLRYNLKGENGTRILALVCEYFTDESLKKLYNSLRKKRSLRSKDWQESVTTIAVKKETQLLIRWASKELGLTVDEMLEGIFKGRKAEDIQKLLN